MNELASKLQEYLREKNKNEGLVVEDFQILRAGFETVKYSFIELSSSSKETTAKKFVLRMFPDNYLGYGVKNEFTVMDRLYDEGYPVSKVIQFEEDKSILGKPFLIMEFIETKCFTLM